MIQLFGRPAARTWNGGAAAAAQGEDIIRVYSTVLARKIT